MGRKLVILLLMSILTVVVIQVFFSDKLDLVKYAKELYHRQGLKSKSPVTRVVDSPHEPRVVENDITPAWDSQPVRSRWLEVLYESDKLPKPFAFRSAVALQWRESGRILVLDYGNKTVELFDSQGNHKGTIGRGTRGEVLLSEPVDIALAADKVFVCDRRKGVLVFSMDGKLLNTIRLPYTAEQVALNSNGNIVLLAPSDRYLIHELDQRGTELLVYARQDEEEIAIRSAFGKGSLAIDGRDKVCVSFASPYRIVEYNRDGKAVIEFSRQLDMLVNPPTFKRDATGKVNAVYRQEISFDLQVGPDGLLYNLVRTKGVKGGNIVDTFSTQGEYLQRLYLFFNIVAFDLHENKLAVISAGRRQSLTIYQVRTIGE
jgi:hypothetical protein